MGNFLGKKRERNEEENEEKDLKIPSNGQSLANTPLKDSCEIKEDETVTVTEEENLEVISEEKISEENNHTTNENKNGKEERKKSKICNKFKSSDKKLLALDEEGINSLTVENLKDLLRTRKLIIGSGKKVDLVTKLVSYLKEKFCKSYINSLINQRKFEKWNLDELKGIMKLHGRYKITIGKVTKKELIQQIEALIPVI